MHVLVSDEEYEQYYEQDGDEEYEQDYEQDGDEEYVMNEQDGTTCVEAGYEDITSSEQCESAAQLLVLQDTEMQLLHVGWIAHIYVTRASIHLSCCTSGIVAHQPIR